jgi:hypothetical protein
LIVSASRRTDIPSFYSPWLINRLKEGNVSVSNPWDPNKITHLDLSPSTVDCIVFWTKDPLNMLDKLEIIDDLGYKYYFLFTVTGYDSSIETGLRDKSGIVKTFQELSRRISSDRVLWRYDPIIISDRFDIGYHKARFNELCRQLHRYTESCTISFADMYKNIKCKIVRPISKNEMLETSAMLLKTAKRFGIGVKACCEDMTSMAEGIDRASCIDKETVGKVCGRTVDIEKDCNQRKGCNCIKSLDIGAYNTCMNGCLYCYANRSNKTAQKYFSGHDPTKGRLK